STGSVTQTVNKADSTTTVTSSLATSAFGQSVTFTATVSASSGTPTGTVQFQIDGVNSGASVSLVNGSATFSTSSLTSALTAGAHTIAARYSGDANFNPSTGSVAQTVTKADSATSVTTSLATSTFGQAVTFTATVSFSGGTSIGNPGTPSGMVQFLIDDVNSGAPVPLVNGSAAFITSSLTSALTAGAHTIAARYGGDP